MTIETVDPVTMEVVQTSQNATPRGAEIAGRREAAKRTAMGFTTTFVGVTTLQRTLSGTELGDGVHFDRAAGTATHTFYMPVLSPPAPVQA